MAAWQTIRQGHGRAVLLAIDFSAGRAQAGLEDLLPNLGGAFGVWHSVFTGPKPGADPYRATDPDRWVQRALDAVRVAGVTVTGVVAYCSAAALALRLGRAIRSIGSATRVVLVDPVEVRPETMAAYFFASFDDWQRQVPAGTLDAMAPDRVRTALRRVEESLPEDPGGLVTLMETISAEYGRACAAVGDRLDLDASFVVEMSEQMRSFVSFLTAAGRIGAVALRCMAAEVPFTTLASREHPVLAPFSVQPVLFDVPYGRMLAAPAVGAWITAAVRPAPPG